MYLDAKKSDATHAVEYLTQRRPRPAARKTSQDEEEDITTDIGQRASAQRNDAENEGGALRRKRHRLGRDDNEEIETTKARDLQRDVVASPAYQADRQMRLQELIIENPPPTLIPNKQRVLPTGIICVGMYYLVYTLP